MRGLRVATTSALIAMVLGVAAPSAQAGLVVVEVGVEDTIATQSVEIPEGCHAVGPATPLPPESPITAIEVCGDFAEVVLSVRVSYDIGCQCVTVWTPAIGSQHDPNYVRIFTRSGVIQQQYPFGSGRIDFPSFCLYTNDPSYSGSPCLL